MAPSALFYNYNKGTGRSPLTFQAVRQLSPSRVAVNLGETLLIHAATYTQCTLQCCFTDHVKAAHLASYTC